MSAEQPEEPAAEPQSEEPKGLLQPSRVGIYVEIEVFAEYGPWKRNSHQYRTAHGQHPPGFQ